MPLIFLSNTTEYVIEVDCEAWLRVNAITSLATHQDYIQIHNELCTTGFSSDS